VTLERASLCVEGGGEVPCMFNPAELKISKSNSWNAGEAKGQNAPKLRFQGGGSGTLSLSLTFDTTLTGDDVSKHVNALLALMDVNPKLPATDKQRNSGRPPSVFLKWGKLHSFKAIIEQLSVSYTYFASDGMPLRAKAELTLKQYEDDKDRPLQNPTSHTDAVHAVHRLVQGETLDRVAAVHYGDPSRWRLIAEANAVLDPLALSPGVLLAIPELPVRRRG
jgi:nucleoid-associated protein YgaU